MVQHFDGSCTSAAPFQDFTFSVVPEGFAVPEDGPVDAQVLFGQFRADTLAQAQAALQHETDLLEASEEYTDRRGRLGLYSPRLVLAPHHLAPALARYVHVARHRTRWARDIAAAPTPALAVAAAQRALRSLPAGPLLSAEELLLQVQRMCAKRCTTGLAACVWEFAFAGADSPAVAASPMGLPADVLRLVAQCVPEAALGALASVSIGWYQVVYGDAELVRAAEAVREAARAQWRRRQGKARASEEGEWDGVEDLLQGNVRAERKQMCIKVTQRARRQTWM